MKLYCFPTPRNVCVFALIDHVGIDVERVSIDLTKGAQTNTSFLRINPNGKTPALVDGDLRLWEHPAIMQYLAEKAGSDLAPKSVVDQANSTRWVSWIQMHWSQGADILGGEFLAKPALGLGNPDQSEVIRGTHLLEPLVPVVDGHLADNEYFLGDALSFVDFVFGGAMAHWKTCRMPLDGASNVLDWYGRLSTLAAWQGNFDTRELV